jgi:cag pathogenicity island protein 24
MKYKRLTPDELKALEQDFISFLASAQITGPDWEKMKKEENHKANELVDVFSDLVYDKVLSKISYLEYRDPKTLNIFYFSPEGVSLVGLRVKETSSLDLTAENVMSQWNSSNNASVNVVRSERKYEKERQTEIFELLQAGCMITNDRLFKLLNSLV